MFDKEQEIGGPGTVVGSNVKLNGVLKDLNDITVHGSVDGEVISEKNVLVSETASVKGPITAQNVTISGKVNGTVNANKKLEITPTGKIYGSITTKDLVIRSGAIFIGKSQMVGHEPDNITAPQKEDSSKTNEIQQTIAKEEVINLPEKPVEEKKEEKNEVEPPKDDEKKSSGFWEKFKDKPKYEVEK